jgi:hypothetical protein
MRHGSVPAAVVTSRSLPPDDTKTAGDVAAADRGGAHRPLRLPHPGRRSPEPVSFRRDLAHVEPNLCAFGSPLLVVTMVAEWFS